VHPEFKRAASLTDDSKSITFGLEMSRPAPGVWLSSEGFTLAMTPRLHTIKQLA